MALGSKSLPLLSSFMVISLILMPLVHSSRTSLQGGKMVAEETARAIQQGLEKGGATSGVVVGAENSAREVPTGPDPLHHNNQPTRP
ncbi:hypothetical protein Tsubulata_043431 [Turnera subulata]|uniref:Uncharacterized protein n=1 Tax=Turnera subulata TaxID=218843 RepID=A0A9Q0G822_9ROSI|nr:hypothetical protein Tsubulata_043431 [Turnera subulata]